MTSSLNPVREARTLPVIIAPDHGTYSISAVGGVSSLMIPVLMDHVDVHQVNVDQ